MRRWLTMLLCLLLPAAEAAAGLVEVKVYDRTARCELPVYARDGRFYVAGTPGHGYSIRLRNRSGEDVLAVVSVDGVNVVSGETAAVDQGGYILSPGQRFDITGWRKSLEQVAKFYFSEPQDAYAARTGRPDELGVIGVAVFRRKPEPMLEAPAEPLRQRREGAAPSAPPKSAAESAADAAPGLGTGHGGSETSVVRHAQFERASSTPAQLTVIEYDTLDNLVARGIVPQPRRAPQPFPAQFVPDPPRR